MGFCFVFFLLECLSCGVFYKKKYQFVMDNMFYSFLFLYCNVLTSKLGFSLFSRKWRGLSLEKVMSKAFLTEKVCIIFISAHKLFVGKGKLPPNLPPLAPPYGEYTLLPFSEFLFLPLTSLLNPLFCLNSRCWCGQIHLWFHPQGLT